VSWVTPRDDGPAGTLGLFATADGRALPRELIPMGGVPGGRVELHLRNLELPPGATVKLAVRAVDGAGNRWPTAPLNVTVSSRVPTRLPRLRPAPAPEPNLTRAALPHLAGMEVAILDELDKGHPLTSVLIPAESEGYLVTNHRWNAKSRALTLQAARNEFIAFQWKSPW
jgi:hypothetical protein